MYINVEGKFSATFSLLEISGKYVGAINLRCPFLRGYPPIRLWFDSLFRLFQLEITFRWFVRISQPRLPVDRTWQLTPFVSPSLKWPPLTTSLSTSPHVLASSKYVNSTALFVVYVLIIILSLHLAIPSMFWKPFIIVRNIMNQGRWQPNFCLKCLFEVIMGVNYPSYCR